MTGRRELADSFRLLATDERWLATDLLVGVVALAVWVAGTGALATQAAGAAGIALGVGTDGAPSTLAVGLFAGLWLVVPAAALVVRLRQRTLNLRGNVEQHYRFDHPAALLVPPAPLVAVVVGVAVTSTVPSWVVALLAVPVGLFALVRTLAFSYRVYGFSRPLLVQVGTFATSVAAFGGALAAVATVAGRGEVVRQSLDVLGLSAALAGGVEVGPVAVAWPVPAALSTVALAAAYVLVQSVVAAVVRLVKPSVDRSTMRTGQRYPPFLEAATPVRSRANGGASSQSTDDPGTAESTDDDVTDGDGDGADGADEEDLDDVSNTRVFTPPSDGNGDADGAIPGVGGDAGDGATDPDSAGQTRTVPAADADDRETDGDATADREHCVACGESFAVDTAVRFCPNCGAALEGE